MSDTQPVSVPPGLPYGNRKELEQSQAAQPMAGAPSPGPSAAPGPGGQPAVPGRPAPGEVPSLEDPSAYPDEPVTAGLPTGAGSGPESLMAAPMGPESLSLLRAVYASYRDEDVRKLIERTELGL